MAYTTIANFRLLTNNTTDDISDADVTSLIPQATYQLNSDMNIRVSREGVLPIDTTRKNRINGTNTTYYVRNWFGKFISDMDNDGGIGTGDITVYQVTSDGTETTLTVSSIDSEKGQFVLSAAPSSGVRLFVTYEWCYRDPATPDKLIELACTNLVASMAFEKINRGLSPEQSFGNVRLRRDMQAGNIFFKAYRNIVDKINSGSSVHFTEAPIF